MARSVTREVLEILWRNDAMRESAERQLAQNGGMLIGLKGEMYVLWGDEWREWTREMRLAEAYSTTISRLDHARRTSAT